MKVILIYTEKLVYVTFIHKYFTTFFKYTNARSYGKLYRYTY